MSCAFISTGTDVVKDENAVWSDAERLVCRVGAGVGAGVGAMIRELFGSAETVASNPISKEMHLREK